MRFQWLTALQKLEAIIHDQFGCGPGSEKIFAREYEIFRTEDSSQLITQRNFSLLQPGSTITMAMVIGRYGKGVEDQCPKPGCKSKVYTKSKAGGGAYGYARASHPVLRTTSAEAPPRSEYQARCH